MTTLMPGQNFIGRDSTCLIVLAGRLVSRRHARVDVTEGGAVVNDLGSKNGTRVNGERIAAPTTLSDGDTIGIGGFELTFRERESGASTLTSVGSSIDL
jgi:pSer/pThr/pTyr-binding forkhead associated (FHA) protein